MALSSIEVGRFPVHFRRSFSHASATRSEADNIIACAVSDAGVRGYGEGCPRSYVTAESGASARLFLREVAPEVSGIADLEGLRSWIGAHQDEIDANPAAFASLEIAVLDMLARERGVPLEALLGLPRLTGAHRYTAVIGDGSVRETWRLWFRYFAYGFRDFKLKLSGDRRRDRDRIAPFRWFKGQRLRLDANNLWSEASECIDHLREIGSPAFAIEEPVQAHDLAGCAEVARRADVAVILDESFLASGVLRRLPGGCRWIVNVRVSKLGGLLRSLAAIGAAQNHDLGIVVGAHVGETGILTRAALPVAAAAGSSLVAQEGAFGTRLLARDLTEPSPMFGFGGRYAAKVLPVPHTPGLGLIIDRSALADIEIHATSAG